MRTRAYWPIAFASAILGPGCSLDQGGLGAVTPTGADAGPRPGATANGTTHGDASSTTGTDSTRVDGGAPNDAIPPGDGRASGDAGPDATTPAEAGPCANGAPSCIVVPSGWTLVAFASTRSTACPAGFTGMPTDLVEGATASASACSCGACNLTTPPTCNSGSVPVHFDNVTGSGGGSCSMLASANTGPLMNNPPGSCGTDLYQGSYAGFDVKYTSPPPSGGACTTPGMVANGGVTYASQDRACTADSAQSANCNGKACTPTVPGPYKACIMSTGTASCPPGPLSSLHLVGTGGSLSCSDCGCTVTGSCSGTVTLYTDTMCTNNAYAVPADDSCNPIYQQQASYSSYIYAGGMPQGVGCQASGSSTAHVTLAGAATICCPP